MKFDRKITITTGDSRKAVNWIPQTVSIGAFYQRLRIPVEGVETMAEYLALPKSQQDARKDQGGFVGGALNGTRRRADSVAGREMITLDLDQIPPGGTGVVLAKVKALGCGYCVYSTRKHAPEHPRLRVILPLDRTVSPEEYEPLARKIGAEIGLGYADPTTFQPSRMMYWPSRCAGSEYVFQWEDLPLLVADRVLGLYQNWRDHREMPRCVGETNYRKAARRQGDPTEKPGIVGAFCRVYDLPGAMETYLPGVYEPVASSPDRYTHLAGSTTGGAVLYDGGKFLFSHHATDPCVGRLVNAFDLVRLHLYGALDRDCAQGTPMNRLPSYHKMCNTAWEDPRVSALLPRIGQENITCDLPGKEQGDTAGDSGDWQERLELHAGSGLVKATMDNIWTILENDPRLCGKFALNAFAGRGEVLGSLPWEQGETRRLWDDNDNQGLYWYLEKHYKLTGNGKIDGALSLHSVKHRFNEIQDYLSGLVWDGIPRLDTLFVDYLGAVDTPYTRTVTRKAFVAAVARAMCPGCKYDTMVILSGPQGIGKSTLLDKMSRGWFNDSIRSFEGKEASELLQGVWLVEVGELDAFRRTDVSRIKQFLSLRVDRFRAAYGRHVKELPRCCVFFGTTNSVEFLRDRTGNRRFWPVDVGRIPHEKTVWQDLEKEIHQLWAEAVQGWKAGESLHLTGELEETAGIMQEMHRESSVREGIVQEFLQRQVPTDWIDWPLDKRKTFWAGGILDLPPLVPRDRICALEVWCEALDGRQRDLTPGDAGEINGILQHVPGWARGELPFRCGYCGVQRGYISRPM